MTGEMSKDEVTRENYPEFFELSDLLHSKGYPASVEPFDQYQGPYVQCGNLKFWLSEYRGWMERHNYTGSVKDSKMLGSPSSVLTYVKNERKIRV